MDDKDKAAKKSSAKEPVLEAGTRKPPDPFWVWAEKKAVGREAEIPTSPSRDEGAARLQLLQQSAANFAAKLPSIAEWAAFLRDEIAPVYNSLSSRDRLCSECGKRVAVEDRAANPTFCCETCGGERATRELAQRSEGERLQKSLERIELKMKACRTCAPDKPCGKHRPELTKVRAALERLNGDADAMKVYASGDSDTTKISLDGLAEMAAIAADDDRRK